MVVVVVVVVGGGGGGNGEYHDVGYEHYDGPGDVTTMTTIMVRAMGNMTQSDG